MVIVLSESVISSFIKKNNRVKVKDVLIIFLNSVTYLSFRSNGIRNNADGKNVLGQVLVGGRSTTLLGVVVGRDHPLD